MNRSDKPEAVAAARLEQETNRSHGPRDPETNEHKFNDDLLANTDDCRAVEELYPTLLDVLHHQTLIDYFKTYNERADTAKKTSRKLGKWAFVLAATAIALAAAEIFTETFAETIGSSLSFVIGGVAAVCGLAGVAVGAFGVLHGSRKREWLHNRFMGERIRQFHFQSIVALFPQIAAASPNAESKPERAKAEFEAQRRRLFLQFQNEFEGHVGDKYASVLG